MKSGTRCNGIPAAMSGSFLHCINFDDEQIPKGLWASIVNPIGLKKFDMKSCMYSQIWDLPISRCLGRD